MVKTEKNYLEIHVKTIKWTTNQLKKIPPAFKLYKKLLSTIYL